MYEVPLFSNLKRHTTTTTTTNVRRHIAPHTSRYRPPLALSFPWLFWSHTYIYLYLYTKSPTFTSVPRAQHAKSIPRVFTAKCLLTILPSGILLQLVLIRSGFVCTAIVGVRIQRHRQQQQQLRDGRNGTNNNIIQHRMNDSTDDDDRIRKNTAHQASVVSISILYIYIYIRVYLLYHRHWHAMSYIIT